MGHKAGQIAMGVFSSRSGGKTPPGAVRAGTEVTFRTADCASGPPSFCVLRDGEAAPQTFPMSPADGGYRVSHIFERAGLYFYWFRFADGSELRRFALGEGRIVPPGAGDAFQQTVYSADYARPEGFAGGVMYQIFPDRFNIGGEVLDPVFPERVLRRDLGGLSDYSFGANGAPCADCFGGNFAGIREKLGYLVSLGVSCVYLNPICEAHSNHRYNTADYMKPDPLLGSERDFAELCEAAHARGIKIILDGVFSHTGDDSVYFNRYGHYPALGAYQSAESEYYNWYKFTRWPEEYKSWWGFSTLPEVNESDESFARFVCGEGGVIDYWLSLGADGFRLDVADELPDFFIERIRAALKRSGPDKLLLGEVWEDASSKISYGARRRYLWGKELDSVMNYPFRTAILDFLRSGDAALFAERVGAICENYPPPMLSLMMNMLSTHDTPRAITALVLPDSELAIKDRAEQARRTLTRDEYLRGVELVKLAFALQFTLPGIPCVYYGDEIGMQGYGDPFCRGFMRWNDADENLRAELAKISALRRANRDVLSGGTLKVIRRDGGVVAYLRESESGALAVVVNRSGETAEVDFAEKLVAVAPWRYAIERVR